MHSVPARRLRSLALALAAVAVPLTVAAPAAAGTSRTVVGTLLQAYPESAGTTAPTDAPLSWVQTEEGGAVRVPTADVADVPAGATVQVTVGGAVRDTASTRDGYGTAHAVVDTQVIAAPGPAPAPPDSAVTNQVTVAMVLPPGGRPDGADVTTLLDAVNGPVAQFWDEQSNGAMRLHGTAASTDWIDTRAGCSDPTALWDEVAGRVGFTPGPGKHLLLYVSSKPGNLTGCSYALGQVEAGPGSGGMAYVRAALPSVIAHELGHNFGLGHSSGRQCDGTVDTGTCRTVGYRDYYDVMGASWESMGSLNAAQEARLGVLPAGQQRTLDASGSGGTVTLSPLSGRSGTRALRLTAPDGTDYWLEYRTATGQDGWLATPANRYGLQSGVLVHRAGPLPDTSLLLDGTPSPQAGWDDDLRDALPVGTPVHLAAGFTVTLQSVTAGGATVVVTTTPAAAAASPAAPSSSPRPRTLPSGGSTGAACHPTAPDPAPAPAPQAATGDAPVTVPAAPVSDHGQEPARPVRVALAASTSPSLLAALTALGGCLVLGGTVLLRVRTIRARRRSGGA